MKHLRQKLTVVERDGRRALVDVETGDDARRRYLVIASPPPKPAWVARYIVQPDATLETARPGRYAEDIPSWAVVQFAERAGL